MSIVTTPAIRSRLWPHRIAVVSISFLLLVISCPLTALYGVQNNVDPVTVSGFALLSFGWLGLFVLQLAWLANFFLPLGWLLLLCRLWIASAVVSLLGCLLALHSLAILHRELPADEGAVNKVSYDALGAAFYVWLAAFVILISGSFWLRRLDLQSR